MSNPSVESKYLDRRTVERYIEKGLVSREGYDSHLAKLQDDSANAEIVNLELLEAEITEDDDQDDDEEEETEENVE